MDVDYSTSADRAVRVARAVDFHLGGQCRVLCQGKPGVGPADVYSPRPRLLATLRYYKLDGDIIWVAAVYTNRRCHPYCYIHRDNRDYR